MVISEPLRFTAMLNSLSRLLFVWDDDNRSKPAGDSGRVSGGGVMEPAPPTYEEALSLFVRDSNGASGGGAHKVDRPVRPAGSRRNTASGAEEDREMAERLQREEFEQYATRERSATARGSQAEGDRDDRADASRSEASDSSSAPPDPADTSRSSDSSLPTVDFSRVHRNLLPLYGQRRPPPPIPGLRTIPESECRVKEWDVV